MQSRHVSLSLSHELVIKNLTDCYHILTRREPLKSCRCLLCSAIDSGQFLQFQGDSTILDDKMVTLTTRSTTDPAKFGIATIKLIPPSDNEANSNPTS